MEESGAVLEDLVSADVLQWDMQVDSLDVAEATTWLGATAGPCQVKGWKAVRFDIKGALGMMVRKKGRGNNCMTFQEYFGCPLPPDACLPELREEFRESTLPAAVSRQPSRDSGMSAPPEAVGTFQFMASQGADDDALLPDIDTLSSTSEVLSQWPDPQAGSLRERDSHACTRRQDSGQHRAGSGYSRGHAAPDQDTVGKRGTKPLSRVRMADKTGKTTQRISASVWLATDFVIPMQQFLPILETLAVEHEAMRRVKELLSSKSLREAVEQAQKAAEAAGGGIATSGGGHVFPVRASVPLNIAVRALVHFEAFELQPPGALTAELFEVPAEYSWVPRREAQKTPSRAKKRMLLANLAL